MNWGDTEEIDGSLALMPRAEQAPQPNVFEGEWWSQFGANAQASATETWRTGLSFSRDNELATAYDAVLYELNQDLPADRRYGNPYRLPAISPFEGVEMQAAQAQAEAAGVGQSQMEAQIWADLEKARSANPGRYANLPKSQAELYEQVYARAREAIDESDRLRARSAPGAAFFGSLAGSLGPSLVDPVNIATAFLGGGGASTYTRLFLQESALGMAGSAALLPQLSSWREEIGRPITGEEALGTVAIGGLSAGVLGVGMRFTGRNFITPAWRSARAALDEMAMNRDVPPNVRSAARAADEELGNGEDNPYGPTADDEQAHAAALNRAMRAVDDGAPAALPQRSDQVVRAADPEIQAAQREEGYTVLSFKPDQLETDAAMMQYKRGGDDAGVTERLQGVKEWNPAFAGQILVFETNDGRRIVADGHQRLGLAKRLQGEGQDVTLYGVILREKDGVTVNQARTIAALKNIAEGSGDSLDAAAVLRIAPEGVTQLPPRSPLVRQARSLARLSSDAWGMVWNGVAGERDAALVGRLVEDPKLHAAILEYVSKAQAETLEEAELMVRQALAAGARQEVQTDMFGAMLKTDLILPERVRILKAALTTLRKDRGLFKTLVDRESRIAAEGNVLNVDANARALESSARVFETIKALAERKGPISDALQTAAVRSKETGNRRAAIGDFVSDVRGRVERGELDGDAPRGPIGAVDVAPTSLDGTPLERSAGGGGAVARGSLFADPTGKPEAFDQQRTDLAMELGGEQMHAQERVAFHGTAAAADFDRFKFSNTKAFAERDEKIVSVETPAGYFTENHELAEAWAQANRGLAGDRPRVIPVEIKGALLEYDANGRKMHEVEGDAILKAQEQGKAGVRFSNVIDSPDNVNAKPSVVSVVFSPDSVRQLNQDLRGDAAAELRLFDNFDAKERVPAIDGTADDITIGELHATLEGEAKAVERLRVCAMAGEG